MAEIVPKKSIENSLQDAPGLSHDLLLALSRAAQSVQRARTELEVYHAVGDQIKSLGEDVSLYVYAEDRQSLTLVHTSYSPNLIRRIETLFDRKVLGLRVVFPPDTVYARSLETGRAQYIRWSRDHISSVMPVALRPLAGQFIRILKIKQGILAPLCVDDESQGLMIVSGMSLTEDDVPAMELFAAQIAISLRNVRLTQQMQAELHARRRMEENAILQSAALEAAANAIAITNKNGIIQWVNPAWVDLTGYTREESIGQSTRILKSEKHTFEFYKGMWDVVLAGEVWRGDLINKRKDGSLYFEEETITPVLDAQGNVTHFIAIKLDVTKRKQTEADLERLARTDPLTGVNNRRYLFELAGHEFDVARRYGHPLSVIMFDLDHFKNINDTFGHIVGDRTLERVTQITSSKLRDVDLIGRYGGEEFLIILPMTEAQQARLLAERLRCGVEALRMETEKGTVSVTLSIGIAEMFHDPLDKSVENIIHRADEALYAAKQAGRNRTVIFDVNETGIN